MSVQSCVFRPIAFALFLAVPAASGCGCGDSTNRVTGIVYFDGKPLQSGTVIFHDADGNDWFGAIDSKGEYEIEKVGAGEAHIAVIPDPPSPSGFQATRRPTDLVHKPVDEPAAKKIPIPKRYMDHAESGLICPVKKGEQTHRIDLTP